MKPESTNSEHWLYICKFDLFKLSVQSSGCFFGDPISVASVLYGHFIMNVHVVLWSMKNLFDCTPASIDLISDLFLITLLKEHSLVKSSIPE